MTGKRMCFAFALGTLASLAACESDPQAVGHAHHHNAPSFSRIGAGEFAGLAKQVRQATARFSSTTQAALAGYAEASPCVAQAGLGGMGVHWANVGLVDPVFEPLQPEAVLYAPKRNGGLELVALEYIVIDIGQTAPTFESQPFDVGGAPLPVPHWSLHVWVHRENPAGLFAPFNPTVVCP